MSASFFFYDLETSGIRPRASRVMQFAGQRTDLDLNPIGDPVNLLIKMTEDVLPDPDSVLITGITPQMTIADGLTEAEFLKTFQEEIAAPHTIFVGYNSVRFDDEFMRNMLYRNFYDPYEWQWQDGRSKWDLLDVVRMTRALRPDGIQWPFDIEGKPTNRLELLTGLNKLDHAHAHDAGSDVTATIEVARLIRNKQTKLFDYLLSMRSKKSVAGLVDKNEPFVYTSGKYSSDYEKTTVVVKLSDHPQNRGALVYNLRYDPSRWKDVPPEKLAEAWRWQKDSQEVDRLPVKTLAYNRCPAVAPMGVLGQESRERLRLDLDMVDKHRETLKSMRGFPDKVLAALDILEKQRQTQLVSTDKDADEGIYDGFFDDQDKQAMRVVRAAEPKELGDLNLDFKDSRLSALLPLYKARNFPKFLNSEERTTWEQFRRNKLLGGGEHSKMAQFLKRLSDIAAAGNLTGHQEYLLEELKLYAESVMPDDEAYQ